MNQFLTLRAPMSALLIHCFRDYQMLSHELSHIKLTTLPMIQYKDEKQQKSLSLYATCIQFCKFRLRNRYAFRSDFKVQSLNYKLLFKIPCHLIRPQNRNDTKSKL